MYKSIIKNEVFRVEEKIIKICSKFLISASASKGNTNASTVSYCFMQILFRVP